MRWHNTNYCIPMIKETDHYFTLYGEASSQKKYGNVRKFELVFARTKGL